MKWRSKISSTIFSLLKLTFETNHFQRRPKSVVRMEESLISRKLFVTAPGLDADDSKVLRNRCEVYGVVEEVITTMEYTFIFLSSGECPGGEKLWFCNLC